MKKAFTLLALLFSMTSGIFAQDVEIKKDAVKIDGETICLISDDKDNRGSFFIDDLTGSHLIYMKWIFYPDLNYYEIYDADDLDTPLCEEEAVTGFRKQIMRKLYVAEVISPKGLDQKALTNYADGVGKTFSPKKK
jgi:hypothetical protein